MTTSQFEDTKARAVNATWGRRCTKLLFVTSYASRLFPSSYVAPSIEGRAHLTAKVMATLRHLHANHLHDYDFFVKADDDTYIVIENLKLLLSNLSADEPSYLGFHFRYNVHQGYMSGGGGYVLSRAALRAVVEEGILRGGVCASDGNDEDVDVGACLERVGVAPYTTHDAFGRHAFHVTGLKDAMVGPLSNYLSEYPTHGVKLVSLFLFYFFKSFISFYLKTIVAVVVANQVFDPKNMALLGLIITWVCIAILFISWSII